MSFLSLHWKSKLRNICKNALLRCGDVSDALELHECCLGDGSSPSWVCDGSGVKGGHNNWLSDASLVKGGQNKFPSGA